MEKQGKYLPEITICRLKTAGKTEKELREELKGQGFTYRDFQNMVKANNYFDGLTVWLSRWAWDGHRSYHLWNWKPEDDEKVMLALYHAEQFHPQPRYKNDFEKFKRDWESEEYDPGCTYTFTPEQVEVIEIVQEEVDTTEPEKTQRAVRQAKEQKYRRRRATKRSYQNRHRKH